MSETSLFQLGAESVDGELRRHDSRLRNEPDSRERLGSARAT